MSGGRRGGRSPVSRRAFLDGLLCLAAAPLARAWTVAGACPEPCGCPWIPRDTLPEAVRLGRAYLAAAPSECSAELLTEALFGVRPGRCFLPDPSSRHAARLRQMRREDCIRGDLVQLEGWLIPRSEARLFALVALTAAA